MRKHLRIENTTLKQKLFIGLLFSLLVLFLLSLRPATVSAAACVVPTPNYGTATTTVNIETAGRYKVWSRIKAPDANNNSFLMEIDGPAADPADDKTCTTVGNTAITANTWTWVGHKDGNVNTQHILDLPAGVHTVRLIGSEAGVSIDRVIFTTDIGPPGCIPSGTGDLCANPPDTESPIVTTTAPANGQVVNGTNVSITATATDDTAVTAVDFVINGVVRGTDTTAPYSYAWNTTTFPNGTNSIVTRARDAASNQGSSSTINVTVRNNPDLIVTGVSWSPASPSNGNAVTFSATIRNQGLVATPANTVHGVSFSVDGTVVTWSNNSTASLAAGAVRTVTANAGTTGATWAATGGNHTILATVDDSSLITESNETNNTLSSAMSVSSPDTTLPTVSLTAPLDGETVEPTETIAATAADTGGSDLARVEFLINDIVVGTDTTAPFEYSWNTLVATNGSYKIEARAVDGAGNSRLSTAINVTVNNPAVLKPGDVNGDGNVNIFDLSMLLSNWSLSGMSRTNGDLTGDGVVNIFDLSLLLSRWGT